MPRDTIGMRLRNVVRSPQRLEQDASYNPMPKKKKSKSKSKASPAEEKPPRPRFTDFNPNLPPAAFPTLDAPRPPTHHAHEDGDQSDRNGTEDSALDGNGQGGMLENLDRLSLLTNPDGNGERSLSPARDIPMDDLDNVMASNGNLNRIWNNNMSRMAAAANDKDSGLGTEMEDSDSDSPPSIQPDPSTEYPNPAWTDLSERMQAEILDNLLQSYTFSAVCQMLGLTPDELNAMVTILESRNKQIELEDTSLEAMRAKQFRELAKVDNSPRVQSQSHQLAFRKASRQTFRGLREAINPEVDFFACEGSEHTTAKIFLRRREIGATHAGSWGNSAAYNHRPEEKEEDEVPFTSFGLDGGPGPSPNPISGFDSTPAKDSKPTSPSSPPFGFQEAFINWLGSVSGSIDTLEYRQRYGKPPLHPRWLTLLNERTMKPEAGLAARTQAQQFNLIRCEDKLSAPPPDVLYDEPLDFLDSEELERRYSVHMRQAQQQRQQRQRQFAGIIRRPITNSYSGPLLGPASYGPSTPQGRSKVVRLRYSPKEKNVAAGPLSASRSSSERPLHRSRSRSRPRATTVPERPSAITSVPSQGQRQTPRAVPLQMQAERQIHTSYAGQNLLVPVTNTSIQSNADGDPDGNCQTPTPGPNLAGLVKTHAFIPLSPSASSSYQPSSTQQSDTELDTEVEEEPMDDDEDDDEMVLVPTPLK
ncbi:uncharacterized protein BDV14DRAFT_194957 [Aspergillus stella-maris]|uniref:uncharacterized protein n=1 Tax=Aspergillus stella-maris TaxID=1810926 RepID=UPI003CCD3F0A